MLGRDFGLSPEAFWPLLCAFNARCVPPWDEALLRKKLASGYKSARAPHPGQASPVVAFAEPAPAIPPPQEPRAMPAGPPATPEGFRPAWQEGIIRGAKGKWANCVRNLQLVLEHDERVNQCFRYNLFSEAVEIATPPWRGWIGTSEWIDDDGAALSAWLARAFEDHPLFTMPIIQRGRAALRAHPCLPPGAGLPGWSDVGRHAAAVWLAACALRRGCLALPCRGRAAVPDRRGRALRTPGCEMDTSASSWKGRRASASRAWRARCSIRCTTRAVTSRCGSPMRLSTCRTRTARRRCAGIGGSSWGAARPAPRRADGHQVLLLAPRGSPARCLRSLHRHA